MIQFSKLMKDLVALMLDEGYPTHVPASHDYVSKILHGACAKLLCFLHIFKVRAEEFERSFN